MPSAAQIANNTSSTYGGVASSTSSSTSANFNDSDLEYTTAPPATSYNGNAPITFGHLQLGWKVLLIIVGLVSSISVGVWWISHMSSKVDQQEDVLKDVKIKTEKLVNDSAVTSAKLQKLDSQVDKLEDKIFDQAQSRSKK
jgi:hypothetical protein